MSISFKKINSMIVKQVDENTELNDEQKTILKNLCEKIYMLESSIQQGSNQQMINDIKGEINLKAEIFKD